MSTGGTLNRKAPRRGRFVLKRQDDSENPSPDWRIAWQLSTTKTSTMLWRRTGKRKWRASTPILLSLIVKRTRIVGMRCEVWQWLRSIMPIVGQNASKNSVGQSHSSSGVRMGKRIRWRTASVDQTWRFVGWKSMKDGILQSTVSKSKSLVT